MRVPRTPTGTRLRRTVALVGVSALLLTACGGNGDDDDAAASGDDDTEETEDAEEADAGEPQEGGGFVFGAFGEIPGLDPVRNQGFASNGGIPGEALYDTLLKITPEGEVEPHMAESLEPLDDAGQQWEMVLREGIEFHDGTELDGEAVVFNIERHQNPEMRSNFINAVSPIASMEADGHTVTFELNHPWAAFPNIFTHVVGMIASPTAVEEAGEDFNQQPVGAGPFEFVSWAPDDELVMTKYDDYWQEGLPYVDEWVQRPMPDAQTRLAALESGEVDAVFSPFMNDGLADAGERDDTRLESNFGDLGGGIMLNTQSEHLEDVRVRQAVAHFIDYDAINQVTHDGHLPEERGIFSPDSPYHTGVEFPGTDPEAGQELLQEYLDETGQDELTLQLRTLPERRGFAELIQQMLGQQDITVEIDMLEVTEYVPAVFGGDYQMTIWSLPHPSDPDLQLYNNFHSQSPQNAPQIENEDLDAAIERGRTSLDEEERVEAYAEVEEILAEQIPYVLTSPSVHVLLTREYLQGVEMRQDGQFDSAHIWLDE